MTAGSFVSRQNLLVLATPIFAAALFNAVASAAEETPSSDGRQVHWTSANDGQGLEFAGTNFLTYETPNGVPAQFTVSVWVNAFDLNGADPNYGRGIARSTADGRIGDWILSVHRPGQVRFIHWGTAGTDPSGSHVTVEPVVGLDYWYHIVAVWDGTTARIYVNGVHQEHADSTSAAGWGTGNEIGRSWIETAYYWQGKIEDFDLYGRPLTPDEIAAEFKSNSKSKPQPKPKPQPTGDPSVSAAIDRHIQAQLDEFQLTPAPTTGDAEFHRRVMLDLAGRIPTPQETLGFLTDESPTKRIDLIDTLLSGRELPIYWSRVMADWLMTGDSRRDAQFLAYLRRGLAQSKSWDEFARDMLLARPARDDHSATMFLSSRASQIKDRSIGVDIGLAFFGVNLRCAQCHDHPSVSQWRQSHTLGLAAFFGRSYTATYKEKDNRSIQVIGELATGEVEYTPVGESKQVAKLMFLDGTVVHEPPAAEDALVSPPQPSGKSPAELKAPPPVPAFSRRQAFVTIAFDPERPYFKRAMVNRVWKKLMGRGLVEPVDMINEDNPPSHPELFRLLSGDFARHGFDLRRLIAVITKSEAYARTSRWPAGARPDDSLYAAAVMKPLDVHQLGISLPMAVGYYDDQLKRRPRAEMGDLRPVAAWKEIIDRFDSEGDTGTTTGQALFLLNSEYFQQELLNQSRLAAALKDDPARMTERVYLKTLSRFPTAAETLDLSAYLESRIAPSNTSAHQEIIWALLTSAEFRFNH